MREGEVMYDEIMRLRAALEVALDEVTRLKAWVGNLYREMYVNCVHCGHRYGPGETTPVSMVDALEAHIE